MEVKVENYCYYGKDSFAMPTCEVSGHIDPEHFPQKGSSI